MTEGHPSTRNNLALYGISATLFVIVVTLGIYLIVGEGDNPDTTSELQRTNSAGQIVDQELTDFSFVANDGTNMSLSDLQGQFVMLTFGYTSCPDVCPATLLEFRRIKAMLGDDADDVAFVFISVDSERDTPEILNRYMRRFDSDFIGLQSDNAQLQAIQTEYGLDYQVLSNENSEAGYMVTHTASRYLIDPNGKLIRIYSFATETDAIAEEIQSLL